MTFTPQLIVAVAVIVVFGLLMVTGQVTIEAGTAVIAAMAGSFGLGVSHQKAK